MMKEWLTKKVLGNVLLDTCSNIVTSFTPKLWFTNDVVSMYKVKHLLSNFISACNGGMFGKDCTEKCGSCLHLKQCQHVNGTCVDGCSPGFYGSTCTEGRFNVHFNNFIFQVFPIGNIYVLWHKKKQDLRHNEDLCRIRIWKFKQFWCLINAMYI